MMALINYKQAQLLEYSLEVFNTALRVKNYTQEQTFEPLTMVFKDDADIFTAHSLRYKKPGSFACDNFDANSLHVNETQHDFRDWETEPSLKHIRHKIDAITNGNKNIDKLLEYPEYLMEFLVDFVHTHENPIDQPRYWYNYRSLKHNITFDFKKHIDGTKYEPISIIYQGESSNE